MKAILAYSVLLVLLGSCNDKEVQQETKQIPQELLTLIVEANSHCTEVVESSDIHQILEQELEDYYDEITSSPRNEPFLLPDGAEMSLSYNKLTFQKGTVKFLFQRESIPGDFKSAILRTSAGLMNVFEVRKEISNIPSSDKNSIDGVLTLFRCSSADNTIIFRRKPLTNDLIFDNSVAATAPTGTGTLHINDRGRKTDYCINGTCESIFITSEHKIEALSPLGIPLDPDKLLPDFFSDVLWNIPPAVH